MQLIALLVSAQRDLLRGDALDRAAEGRNEITVVLVVAGVVSLADRAGTEEQDWAELRAQGEVHSDLHSDLHSYLPQSEALFAQLDADGDGVLASSELRARVLLVASLERRKEAYAAAKHRRFAGAKGGSASEAPTGQLARRDVNAAASGGASEELAAGAGGEGRAGGGGDGGERETRCQLNKYPEDLRRILGSNRAAKQRAFPL